MPTGAPDLVLSSGIDKGLENALQNIIGLLEKAEKLAQGVTSGGGSGASKQAVDDLSKSVISLETNFSKVTTAALSAFETIQQKIEGTASRMLAFTEDTRRAGEELDKTGKKSVGGGAPSTSPTGVPTAVPVPDLRAGVNDTIALIQQSKALEAEFDALGRFSKKFGGDFQQVTGLVDKGLAELTNQAGTTQERFERLSSASKTLKDQIAAIGTARTTVGQEVKDLTGQQQQAKGGLDTEADKQAFAERAQRIQSLSLLSSKLADEQRILSDTNKLLTASSNEVGAVLKQEAAEAAVLAKAREKEAQEKAKQAEIDKAFQAQRPIRVQEADSGRTLALGLQAKAITQVTLAERALKEAQESGKPERITAATLALEKAREALKAADDSLTAAENKLKVAQDPKATVAATKSVNDIADGHRKAASAASSNATQHANLAKSLEPVRKSGAEVHDRLLAILGVSRFLPGALGQAVSGFALLEGAMRSESGVMTGIIGIIATLIVKSIELGFTFNQNLNTLRVQSQGLGLALETTKAIQVIMESTGGSIENVSIGIRHLNEAVTGIGPNANRTATALRIAFGDDFQVQGAKTEDVLRSLFEVLDEESPKFLGVARANIVASEIFQRNFDEIKGRAHDLNKQLESTIGKIKDTGQASKESAKEAEQQAEAVRQLKLSFDGLISSLRLPIVATVLIKLVTDPGSIEGSELEGVTRFLNRIGPAGPINALIDHFVDKKKREIESQIDEQKKAAARPTPFDAELDAKLKELTVAQEGASRNPQNFQGIFQPPNILQDANVVRIEENIAELKRKRADFQAQSLKADQDTAKTSKEVVDQNRIIGALQIQEGDSVDVQIAKLERQKKQLDKQASEAEKNTQAFSDNARIAEDEVRAAAKLPVLTSNLVEKQKKRNEADKQFNDSLAVELKFTEQANKISEQISELKKKTRDKKFDISGFQLQREPLLEDIQAFKPGTPDFTAIKSQILAIDDAIVKALQAAGGDKNRPELTKAIRQRFQDEIRLNKEVAQQQRADFEGALESLKASGAAAVEDLRTRIEQSVQTEQILFNAGFKGIGDLSKAELDNIERVAEEFRAVQDTNIARIKVQIAQLRVDIQDPKSGVTFVEGSKQINALQKQIDAEDRLKQLSRDKEAHDTIAFQETERQRIINARLELFDIETRLQESANARRLELLKRAAQDSILTRQQEIDETDRIEREQIQREIDRVANHLRDETFLRVNAERQGNAQTGTVENVIVKSLPDQLQNVSVQAIDSVVRKLQLQGADASPEALKALKELIALRQQLIDLEQKTGIARTDENVAAAQRLLDIKKQELTFAEELLSIDEARLNFLDQEGLIATKFELNEDRIDIEKRRLAVLQQQAAEIQRQRDLTVAGLAEKQSANQGGAPVTRAQILEIQGRPEVAGLNLELLKLSSSAQIASDKIFLMDSVLGRIRTGLDQVIGVLDSAPTQFDAFSTSFIKIPLAGLATAFKGVQKLVDVFLSKDLKPPKTPAEELATAATQLKTGVENAAVNFKTIIQQAAQEFKAAIIGGAPGASGTGTASAVGGGLAALLAATRPRRATRPTSIQDTIVSGGDLGFSIPQEGKSKFGDLAGKIISKGATIASGIISGLTAESVGGKIAGFASAASIIPVVGPLISAVGSIVGGVADLIGSQFKARAQKAADDFGESFKKINDQLRDGSITLGEGIAGIQKSLETARAQLGSGKVNKKGGAALLKQIETQAGDALAQLRKQAKDVQDAFIKSLGTERLAPELRSIATAVDDAEKKVTDFLNSFEHSADALQHLGEAQEFLNLTLQDLKTTATDQLTSIIAREHDAQLAFERSRQQIVDQGKVQSPFQAAADRLQQLFDLEKKRAEERAAAQSEEAKLQNQISLIDQSFVKAASLIDKMRKSFDSLTAGLASVFGSGGGSLSSSNGIGSILRDGLSIAPASLAALQSNFSGSLSIDVSISGLPSGAQVQATQSGFSSSQQFGVPRITINRGRPLV